MRLKAFLNGLKTGNAGLSVPQDEADREYQRLHFLALAISLVTVCSLLLGVGGFFVCR